MHADKAEEDEVRLTERYGAVIDALARETGTELEHVKELYERELAQLEATAKVRGFLPVLAASKVRVALRRLHAGKG